MGANRNLGSDNKMTNPPLFNPGGEDFGVVRTIDGHHPGAVGEAGRNVHYPNGTGDPGWHDPVTDDD